MRISAIVATSENGVIGKNNQLPWHLPADLKHFKKVTLGNPVLMGRKTYESIGRPLPGRQNIIITRDTRYQAPGCKVVHSIERGLEVVNDQEEVFLIGGALLYQEMLPQIQRLYLTVIHHVFEGDAFFPKLIEAEWKEIERVDCSKDTENNYEYSFLILDRRIR